MNKPSRNRIDGRLPEEIAERLASLIGCPLEKTGPGFAPVFADKPERR